MARVPRRKPADDAAAAAPGEGEAASDGWTELREWEVRHAFVERASAQPYCVVGHPTIAGQPWEGPDAERRAAGRRARERFIERFERRQRETHAWIKLAWVADWLARKRRSTKLSEKRRARAYAQLEAAVMEGKFDRDGRSCVLFLRPDWPRVRMTREELARVRRLRPDLATFQQFFPDAAEPPDDAAVFQDLANCWVPRDLAQRWFEKGTLPLPAHLFPLARIGELVGHQPDAIPAPPRIEAEAPVARRPRKPRGRDYRAADAPLLDEMAAMIADGRASGADDAARAVADRAEGGRYTQSESKVKRLLHGYSLRSVHSVPIGAEQNGKD